MEPPALDPRLSGLQRLVGDAQWVADIGADHGYLAYALLRENQTRRLLVADISNDSLAKALSLFRGAPEAERATFVVADGLEALKGWETPGAIILAGMGAGLIAHILENGKERIGQSRLCLQPNRNVEMLRTWLYGNGFFLLEEELVQAAGRYYVLLCAQSGKTSPPSAKALFLGPYLMQSRPPLYRPYLMWRAQVLRHALRGLESGRGARDQIRRAETKKQLKWIEEELI